MTKEDIIAVFPAKVWVTQEIIDKSNVSDVFDCIGVHTLLSLLPDLADGKNVWWGCTDGVVKAMEGKDMHLIDVTSGDVDMTQIKKPKLVEFKIKGRYANK